MEKYHMNLQEREITDHQEIKTLLLQGKYAVIAMCRENLPYIVTLNYGYDPNIDVMYFHSAPTGHKMDILTSNPRVSATIIDDRGYLEGQCSHSYRSVIINGQITVVSDPSEKEQGMRLMLHQLEQHPEKMEDRLLKSDKFLQKTTLLKLVIETKRAKKGQ